MTTLAISAKTTGNIAWFVNYVLSVELFPTCCRVSGMNTAASIALVFGIGAPYVILLVCKSVPPDKTLFNTRFASGNNQPATDVRYLRSHLPLGRGLIELPARDEKRGLSRDSPGLGKAQATSLLQLQSLGGLRIKILLFANIL